MILQIFFQIIGDVHTSSVLIRLRFQEVGSHKIFAVKRSDLVHRIKHLDSSDKEGNNDNSLIESVRRKSIP